MHVANVPGGSVEAHVIECEVRAGPLDRRAAAERRLRNRSPHGAVVAKPCAERSLQARCTPPERGNPTRVIGGRGVTVWCAESAFGPVWRRSAAEVTQSTAGRPRAGKLASDVVGPARTASAIAAPPAVAAPLRACRCKLLCLRACQCEPLTVALHEAAKHANSIRDGGMRPLQHIAAADKSISVVPLHSVAVIDKSMSVVNTTAGAGAHASAMKKKRWSHSASDEPRSAGQQLRTCAGLAGTCPGGVLVRLLLSRLQVSIKCCKTVITSESSIDQSRNRRKRLLT